MKLFVPYTGKSPAHVLVNGHRVIVCAPQEEQVEDVLSIFGGDSVKKLRGTGAEPETNQALGTLARKIKGHVVVAPAEISLQTVISQLESELPWIQ